MPDVVLEVIMVGLQLVWERTPGKSSLMHMGCVCRGDMGGMGVISHGWDAKSMGGAVCLHHVQGSEKQMARIVQRWAEGGEVGPERNKQQMQTLFHLENRDRNHEPKVGSGRSSV